MIFLGQRESYTFSSSRKNKKKSFTKRAIGAASTGLKAAGLAAGVYGAGALLVKNRKGIGKAVRSGAGKVKNSFKRRNSSNPAKVKTPSKPTTARKPKYTNPSDPRQGSKNQGGVTRRRQVERMQSQASGNRRVYGQKRKFRPLKYNSLRDLS